MTVDAAQRRPDAVAAVVAEGRLASLDGYRAIAAFLVLITHVAFLTGWVQVDPVGKLASRFDWGVTIFFLLSGFLLYRPWARAAMTAERTPRIRGYLWRRALRILPAYWLLVVVVLLWLPAAAPPHPLRTWLTYLGVAQTYTRDPLVEGLTHTWSLGAEISFYLALPVIAWVITRVGRGDPDRSARAQLVGLGGVAAVGLAFTVARGTQVWADPRTGFWLPTFLDWFALGMAAAVIHERRRLAPVGRRTAKLLRLADDTGTCLVIAMALLLVAATPVGGSYLLEQSSAWSVVARHMLYAAAAAFFLAPGFLGHRHDLWQRLLTLRVGLALGRWSYGVFLWHLAVVWTLMHLAGLRPFTGGAWWLLPSAAVCSTAVAALSWRLVERPASRLRGRVRA
ncbi:MAG: acyltransferase family protein [Candidatus Nanopelagicales bacterium]